MLKHIHIGGFQEHKKEQGNYEKMYRDLHWMRTDALVADRLHGSPRTYDVYGYCGLSMFSEYFRHGTIEDVLFPEDYDRGSDDESESEDICAPANALKPRQKLQLALNLAEAVADLHGYSGGKIVHQDLTPSQFLWNDDRTLIKLNDFNRAEIMLWNDAKEQYCDYSQPDIRFVSKVSFLYTDFGNLYSQASVSNFIPESIARGSLEVHSSKRESGRLQPLTDTICCSNGTMDV